MSLVKQLTCALAYALLLLVSGCGGGGDGETANNQNGAGGDSGNTRPTIQGAPTGSVVASESYTFQPSANDPNGDSLSFSASNLPSWLSLDSATGRLTGTPSSADVGTYSGITITVSDGSFSASLAPFAITVSDIGTGVATLSWMPPTQNADGSALTNLSGYQIRYGRAADDLSSVVTLNDPTLSVYVIENLSAGTWYFAVASMNSGGVASHLSNVASKTIG